MLHGVAVLPRLREWRCTHVSRASARGAAHLTDASVVLRTVWQRRVPWRSRTAAPPHTAWQRRKQRLPPWRCPAWSVPFFDAPWQRHRTRRCGITCSALGRGVAQIKNDWQVHSNYHIKYNSKSQIYITVIIKSITASAKDITATVKYITARLTLQRITNRSQDNK